MPRLVTAGHSVRVLSRQDDPALPHGASAYRGDLNTEEGLDAACAGAEVLIHCASAPFGRQRKTNIEGTRAMAEAVRRTGTVEHVIYPSIVGCDRIPLRYYKTKAAAELVIAHFKAAWTVQRCTQFHDLIYNALDRVGRLPTTPLPRGISFQPLDTGETADRFVELVGSGPAGRADDVAGPEVRSVDDLAAEYLQRTGRQPRLLPLPVGGKVAAAFRAGHHIDPDRAHGRITWEDFLDSKLSPEGNG